MDEHQQNPILVNACREFERRILHDKTVRATQEWLDCSTEIVNEFKCKCWLAKFESLGKFLISFNAQLWKEHVYITLPSDYLKDPKTIPIYERNHD